MLARSPSQPVRRPFSTPLKKRGEPTPEMGPCLASQKTDPMCVLAGLECVLADSTHSSPPSTHIVSRRLHLGSKIRTATHRVSPNGQELASYRLSPTDSHTSKEPSGNPGRAPRKFSGARPLAGTKRVFKMPLRNRGFVCWRLQRRMFKNNAQL